MKSLELLISFYGIIYIFEKYLFNSTLFSSTHQQKISALKEKIIFLFKNNKKKKNTSNIKPVLNLN
jgi:hypothetical protein